MLNNKEIAKMVGFLKYQVPLEQEYKKFESSLLYNWRRYNGQSTYLEFFDICLNKGLIKVEKFFIASKEEIERNEKQIKSTRIFKQIPSYQRERDFENLYLAYVYENIISHLKVQIRKEFELPYNFYGFPKKIEANFFVKECDLIITKDNHSFDEFFSLLLINNTKLCIIQSDCTTLDAFILEKTDIFNKNIGEIILKENEDTSKRLQEAVNRIHF